MSEVLNPISITNERVIDSGPASTRVSLAVTAQVLEFAVFYGLLVLIALTAIPYGTAEPWWKAAFECGAFGLGLMWTVHGALSGRWFVPEHRILIPLLALAGFAIFQSSVPVRSLAGRWLPVSASPYDTTRFAYQLLALIVAGGILLRFTNSRRRLWALINLVIGIGLASTIFGFARMAFQHKAGFLLPGLQPDDGTVTRGVGFGQFINHNHFAFLVEMSLGLLLGLMLRRPIRWMRLLFGMLLAIPMWVAVVYSGSRGGLVSVLGEVVFVALMVFIAGPGHELIRMKSEVQRLRRLGPFLVTRVILIGFFLVVLIVGMIWVGGDPLALHLEAVPNEFGVTQSDRFTRTYRSTIWPMTWQMIRDHPIAGTGFGGYWIAITKYHQGSGEMTPQEAHNDYLELLASGGVIGAGLLIWFTGLIGMRVGRQFRSPDSFQQAVCLGAITGILGIAIHSVVDFGLHLMINALVLTILIVLASGPALRRAPGSTEPAT